MVVGTLLTGSGSTISASLTQIVWNTDPGSNPAGPPYNGEVANGTNITFMGCASGTLGAVGCLDAAPDGPNEAIDINQANPLTAAEISGLGSVTFLTFAGNGVTHTAIVYTLTAVLEPAITTNCAGLGQGQSCVVVAGSPIELTLEGSGTTATLNLSGTVNDGTTAVPWSGKFSATFPTTSPATLQSEILGGQTVTSSNSGSFFSASTPTVPEPTSMTLIGAGLIGFAFVVRRKKKTAV
jgi:hypothetical protein